LHYEKFADGSVKCIEDEIPFELPDGWCWARLKHICMMAAGKAKSSDQIKSEPFDGCYPCFGGNGINIGNTTSGNVLKNNPHMNTTKKEHSVS
jgi:hypothetical protein